MTAVPATGAVPPPRAVRAYRRAVRREHNELADRLVNDALDAAAG